MLVTKKPTGPPSKSATINLSMCAYYILYTSRTTSNGVAPALLIHYICILVYILCTLVYIVMYTGIHDYVVCKEINCVRFESSQNHATLE